ncbi:MAG: DUF444 family protein [Planctomycetia bacterium]|nr:DUF444 family protein [Planctomycetia bacterium]
MDVSGSMGEREKDLAKRFFMLLHLFLKRRYERLDVVFIRHTHDAQEVDEDTDLVFSADNGNALAVADVDLGSLPAEITLSVTNGLLTLGGTTGLTFTTGDGTADATLAFTGTRTDVNAALAGLVYRPISNFHGSDLLTITTSDVGGSGSGGPLTDTDTVAITVVSVNDAPTDIALSTSTVAENMPVGTTVGTLSSTDVDAGDTFTYSLVAGVGDSDNASFAIEGNTLKTAAAFDFEAKTSCTVRVRSTDAGGRSTEKAFMITVANVNEAAIISLPESFRGDVVEDAAVDGDGLLSAKGRFVVVDPDAGESVFDTIVTVPDGQTNVGVLTVDAAGNYAYSVANSLPAVQALRAGEVQTDRFVVRSVDGTTRSVSFRINGVADTLAGAVADGYLRNARLFADSNANGVLDWTDAGAMNGVWDVGEGEAWTTTDANGGFMFDFGAPTATLVTIGGTDISTGKDFVASLSAPAGSTIVNPLTTLVAAVAARGSLTVPQAAQSVRTALGLPGGVNLTSYDPLAQPAGDATALAVQRAAAVVANVIVAATNNSIDAPAVVARLAGLVATSAPGGLDLASEATLISALTVPGVGPGTPPPATLVAGLVVVNTAVRSAATVADIAARQVLIQQGTPFASPAVTSVAAARFATGIAGSLQMVASGYPTPTFSTAGVLPAVENVLAIRTPRRHPRHRNGWNLPVHGHRDQRDQPCRDAGLHADRDADRRRGRHRRCKQGRADPRTDGCFDHEPADGLRREEQSSDHHRQPSRNHGCRRHGNAGRYGEPGCQDHRGQCRRAHRVCRHLHRREWWSRCHHDRRGRRQSGRCDAGCRQPVVHHRHRWRSDRHGRHQQCDHRQGIRVRLDHHASGRCLSRDSLRSRGHDRRGIAGVCGPGDPPGKHRAHRGRGNQLRWHA